MSKLAIFDNSNITAGCLETGELHLQKCERGKLAMSFKKKVFVYWTKATTTTEMANGELLHVFK